MQKIGFAVPNWQPCLPPCAVILKGRTCYLEQLQMHHADDLFRAYSVAHNNHWCYLPCGPFLNFKDFKTQLARLINQSDALHFAVIDVSHKTALGTLALMRIQAEYGVIEIGSVNFSPKLQRSTLATEAQFLLMRYIFEELKYRRYEWKCDSLNSRSICAAKRLGFTYEGCFRQAMIYKGRNRDTSWFSIIDSEWPQIKTSFQQWLAPSNFDCMGIQIKSLQNIRTTLSP